MFKILVNYNILIWKLIMLFLRLNPQMEGEKQRERMSLELEIMIVVEKVEWRLKVAEERLNLSKNKERILF